MDEPPLSMQGWLRLGTLVTLAGAVVWLGR
jgi:hypothetical protein